MMMFCINCGSSLPVTRDSRYPLPMGRCMCGVIMVVTPAALAEIKKPGTSQVHVGVEDVEEHHFFIPDTQDKPFDFSNASPFTKSLLFGIPVLVILIMWHVMSVHG